MGTLWTKGPSSIRELQEAFPEEERPAYTTVQTVVYRLEFKKAVRRTEQCAAPRRSATRMFSKP
jgi:predicted transcriptional regulator